MAGVIAGRQNYGQAPRCRLLGESQASTPPGRITRHNRHREPGRVDFPFGARVGPLKRIADKQKQQQNFKESVRMFEVLPLTLVYNIVKDGWRWIRRKRRSLLPREKIELRQKWKV